MFVDMWLAWVIRFWVSGVIVISGRKEEEKEKKKERNLTKSRPLFISSRDLHCVANSQYLSFVCIAISEKSVAPEYGTVFHAGVYAAIFHEQFEDFLVFGGGDAFFVVDV